MAFKTKVDCFGLAGTDLELVATTTNKTAQVADAQDETGAVVATTVYGEVCAPTCDYKVKAVCAKEDGAIKWLFCIIRKMLRTRVADDPT